MWAAASFQHPPSPGDNAPGETWHMVFSTEGEVPYRGERSLNHADGEDKNGKPTQAPLLLHRQQRAARATGDSTTVNRFCVKRLLIHQRRRGVVKGVCSNFLCQCMFAADSLHHSACWAEIVTFDAGDLEAGF
ncbi:hypothetical protein ZWY2020_015281 [Hordeum vulgare]|nr:hypothetical protein ZWY2020_015281 [Hordeum vulgare]